LAVGQRDNLDIDFHLEDGGAPQDMGAEVREGLEATPKRLPSKYFYDERGSELFERITRLPEYYLTRSEVDVLELRAPEIARRTGFEELVELGSGVATKVRILIDAGLAHGTLRRYVPFEVSQDTVSRSARELAALYPSLDVHAVVGDFEQHLGELPHGDRRLIILLGSTIGNFPQQEGVEFLRKITRLMNDEDMLLLGTDLVKSRAALEAAYNDSQGVTAEFNRNILNVINEHLQGNFEPEAFEHVAYYNDDEARIESYLRSTCRQTVNLEALELEVELEEEELIWTEVSCKYTRASVGRLLERSGLRLDEWFPADDGSFALSVSRRKTAPRPNK
jgi:L-histidine N-alpha-methyltransferase